MGEKISLRIDERTVRGKKVRLLRQRGLVPGVVYGKGMEPQAIQADASEVKHVVELAGKHTPVSLSGAQHHIAMIKDVEYSPLKVGIVRHISFHVVSATELVHTEVPIRLVGMGESEAEKSGLVILQALDRVEVKALPMDLPEAVEVDVRSLSKAGERLTLGEAVLPKGVTFVEHVDASKDDGGEDIPSVTDAVVAHVYEPAALEAANEAAAGEASEVSEVPSEGDATTPDAEVKSE